MDSIFLVNMFLEWIMDNVFFWNNHGQYILVLGITYRHYVLGINHGQMFLEFIMDKMFSE